MNIEAGSRRVTPFDLGRITRRFATSTTGVLQTGGADASADARRAALIGEHLTQKPGLRPG